MQGFDGILDFILEFIQTDNLPLLLFNKPNCFKDFINYPIILLLMVIVKPKIINSNEQTFQPFSFNKIQERSDFRNPVDGFILNYTFPQAIFHVELCTFIAIHSCLIAAETFFVTVLFANIPS